MSTEVEQAPSPATMNQHLADGGEGESKGGSTVTVTPAPIINELPKEVSN